MSSLNLVDPEILPLLELLPVLDLNDESVVAIREMMNAPNPDLPAPVIAPQETRVPGLNGAPEVPVLIFDPPGRTNRAAILHFHGGGMVIGSAASSSVGNAMLAQDLGVLVVSVEYRLAPEHPFPAAQEDCVAAYDWLRANAERLNVDPERIVVFGESAGGCLAATVAHKIRDTGRPLPAGQVLTYPMLDHLTGSEKRPAVPNTGEFVWTPELNRYAWGAYQGSYGADDHRIGWFAAAHAKDLSGLPRAWIGVGSLDLFFGENLDYAKRLVAAGVPVETHVYPGGFHAFNMMPTARIAQEYNRDLRAVMRRFLSL